MFQKRIYVVSTGDPRERNDGTNYYVIWEISVGRPIYPEYYAPYLDWIAAGNTPEVIDITPTPPVTDTNPSTEERLTAVEQYLVEQKLKEVRGE